MFRTFILGIVLGVAAAGALAHFVPAVDLHREASLVSVKPNGGNTESFHILVPRDRIVVGRAGAEDAVPPGLEWPETPELASLHTELFKIRDRNDKVIGVANRFASATEGSGPFIQWALHFPARGTMLLQMQIAPNDDGLRLGTLRAGTREFAELTGRVREQFTTDVEEADYDITGRIDLVTELVGPQDDGE